MTENKRFQVIWKCLDDSTEFQDNLTKTIFTVQDVCKLLNELNNQADAVRTELQLCEEENTELQKENEQLKLEINMLKTTIRRNETYIQRMKYGGEWK